LFSAFLSSYCISFPLQAPAQGQVLNEKKKVFLDGRRQTKIPPDEAPKDIIRFLTPRCAMQVSYRKPLIHELGNFQEGKYEEERRKKGRKQPLYRELASASVLRSALACFSNVARLHTCPFLYMVRLSGRERENGWLGNYSSCAERPSTTTTRSCTWVGFFFQASSPLSLDS